MKFNMIWNWFNIASLWHCKNRVIISNKESTEVLILTQQYG